MGRQPLWDPDFIDTAMDEIKEMIEDAQKSRSKHFEETFTMHAMGHRIETITVTVKFQSSPITEDGCDLAQGENEGR